MASSRKNRSITIADLVEMLPGEGVCISLLATEKGLQIGATAGDADSLKPTTITWAKLARMRRAATWAAHLVP